MSKTDDAVWIFRIRKILCEIKTLGEKEPEEIPNDSETIRLVKLKLLNLGGYIDYLSDSLTERYLTNDWAMLSNLGKSISEDDISFSGIWEKINKNLSGFETLINSIIELENYDFSEQERLEGFEEIHKLSNTYDFRNLYAYQEKPLRDLDIPEIGIEESQQYGHFKIEIIGYGSEEDDEYSVEEHLYLEKNGEWKPVLYNRIKGRKLDYEHGRISESTGTPFQRTMYVDSDDLVYYIEDESGILFCSVNKMQWYRYNVEPHARPYHGRISKLRKFRILDSAD